MIMIEWKPVGFLFLRSFILVKESMSEINYTLSNIEPGLRAFKIAKWNITLNVPYESSTWTQFNIDSLMKTTGRSEKRARLSLFMYERDTSSDCSPQSTDHIHSQDRSKEKLSDGKIIWIWKAQGPEVGCIYKTLKKYV